MKIQVKEMIFILCIIVLLKKLLSTCSFDVHKFYTFTGTSIRDYKKSVHPTNYSNLTWKLANSNFWSFDRSKKFLRWDIKISLKTPLGSTSKKLQLKGFVKIMHRTQNIAENPYPPQEPAIWNPILYVHIFSGYEFTECFYDF